MPSKAELAMQRMKAAARPRPPSPTPEPEAPPDETPKASTSAPAAKPPTPAPRADDALDAEEGEAIEAVRPYLPGRRVPCPECATDMRSYCSRVQGAYRLRYYKCRLCRATDQRAEALPREEVDAAYRDRLAQLEIEAAETARAEELARVRARAAVEAGHRARAASRAAAAELKACREEGER